MKKIALALILAISCYSGDIDKVSLNQEGSEKINLKNLELIAPLLLRSVRLWANIHEEDIHTFSVGKLENVTKTKEFYGIHMVTVFEYCKIVTSVKTSVICIDKDYLK